MQVNHWTKKEAMQCSASTSFFCSFPSSANSLFRFLFLLLLVNNPFSSSIFSFCFFRSLAFSSKPSSIIFISATFLALKTYNTSQSRSQLEIKKRSFTQLIIEKSHNYLDTQKLIKLNIQFDGTKCYPIKTYLFHERKHLIFFVFNHFKLLLNKCFYFMNKINIILQMTNLNRDIIRKLMQYKYQNPKMISFTI